MRRIIHAVRGWISGGAQSAQNTSIVYVYSPGREAPNGELNANDQMAILRRLSSFVGKENTPVTVIFPGRPSRKVPDGAAQSGVLVRYATGDQLQQVALGAVADARGKHAPVLATNHPELEKRARHDRIKHIRATTFEEALDVVCGPLRREQQQQQQQRRPQQQGQQPQQRPSPQPPQPPQAEALPQQAQAAPQDQDTGAAASAEAPTHSVAPDAAPVVPAAPAEPRPAPRSDSAPRRLHRHEPSAKHEIKDQAILDLIDPL